MPEGAATAEQVAEAGQEHPKRAVASAAFLVAGGGLVVWAVIGALVETNYVVVDALVRHPLLFGGLASICFITGAVLARRGSALQATTGLLGVAGLVLVGFATVLLVVFPGIVGGFVDTREIASPSGRHVAILSEGSALIDPLYEVRVVTGSGLAQREWTVGCWNGDDDGNSVDEVTWEGDARLVITTVGGDRFEATVDPESGKPSLSPSSVC